MATIKKSVIGSGVPKFYTRCDIPNEDGCNCLDCAKNKITEPFGDLKCILVNHVPNVIMPGLVCKDFKRAKNENS